MKLVLKIITTVLLGSTMIQAQEIKTEMNKEIKRQIKISYVLDIPKGKTNLPLIVFLHGSGERGTNLELVKAHSPFTYKNLIQEEVAILAPQCPDDKWWDTNAVYDLINEIATQYKIDKNRIYLTGLSMGGWGTLKLAMEHPEMFASVASVCAPVDRVMLANIEQYKNLNIKIYHGGLDEVVLPENAFKFYQALHPINQQAELIIFPNDNHNSWDSTYSNPEFYKWLLSNKK